MALLDASVMLVYTIIVNCPLETLYMNKELSRVFCDRGGDLILRDHIRKDRGCSCEANQ